MTNGNIAMAREILDDKVQEAAKALDEMKLPALRARYREVFKEDTVSHNGPWLRKRMKYRLQEIAFGGLSERAQARIRELAVDAPVRRRGFPVTKEVVAPKTAGSASSEPGPAAESKRDPRLPPAGTTLRRQYGKTLHLVVVEADGFVFRGEKHDSLSKVARLITQTNWNGFTFFGLTKAWGAR